MKIREMFTDVYKFMGIVICFLAAGASIGFVQGLVAFRLYDMEYRIFLSALAAIVGSGMALLTGLFLYLFIGNRLTKKIFFQVALFSFIVGVCSAYILSMIGPGVISAFITPIATIIITIYFKVKDSSALN